MDNRVPMMRLNPVTDGSNCVDRGLFCDNMEVYQLLATPMFKKILLTDATTEDGEDKVTTKFKVQKEWNHLLDECTQTKEPSLVMNGTMSYYFL